MKLKYIDSTDFSEEFIEVDNGLYLVGREIQSFLLNKNYFEVTPILTRKIEKDNNALIIGIKISSTDRREHGEDATRYRIIIEHLGD